MDENDTVEEQPVDSIADELSAAFDQAEEAIEEPVEEVTEEVSEEPVEASEEPAEATGEQEAPAITAPEHWAQADKELFAKAPGDIQQWMLDRHKAMEGDYTRKTQEIAEFRKSWEPVQKLYEPHVARLQQMGMTPQQHIERLAQADLYLSQDPVNAMRWLAQNYGVDLNQLVEGQEEVSPEVSGLRNELNQLRQSISAQEQAANEAKRNTIMSQIESFATEADEQGNPLRPHFDEVVSDLVYLAQAERAAGREPDLNTLYDKAVWANPEVREKVLAASKEAEAKKAEQEAIAKAAKAKKASRSVDGAPGGTVPTDDLSLREQLNAAFN